MEASANWRLSVACPVLDGAMGTELLRYPDVDPARLVRLNVEQPERVRAVHRAYAEIGVGWLSTNTLLAHLEHDRDALTKQAVALCKQVAPKSLVVVSMGPIRPGAPEDYNLYDAWATEAFYARANFAFLETQTHLDAARRSVDAHGYGLCITPFVVSFVTNEAGTHLLGCGTSLVRAVAQIAPDVVAIGINCVSPATLARALPVLLGANRPLVLRPSAPFLQNSQTFAGEGEPSGELTPYTWAKSVARLWNLCRLADVPCLVGGCCGSGPEHIAALHREVTAISQT